MKSMYTKMQDIEIPLENVIFFQETEDGG